MSIGGGFSLSRDFRDPVVIIRTPSACKRYGDYDGTYETGGYNYADIKTYQAQNGLVWSGNFMIVVQIKHLEVRMRNWRWKKSPTHCSVVLVNYNFNWMYFSMAFLKFS